MANLRANRITSTEVFETTGSVQFDGTGDYLSVGTSSTFNYLHDRTEPNWTIEGWIYFKETGSYDALFGNNSGTAQVGIYLGKDISDRLVFAINKGTVGTTAITLTSTETFSSGQWYHIAVTNDNYLIKTFINGVNVNTGYWGSASTNDANTTLNIGRLGTSSVWDYNGHISNLRVLKGTALYTENFTPSTRELEVIPNTVLLACQSTTNAAEEKTGKTITVNGNAVANELTPGLLTSVVKSGGSSAITGSVEFDGNDYLSLADSGDWDIAGDYTIEFWTKLNVSDASYTDVILATGTLAGSTGFQIGVYDKDLLVRVNSTQYYNVSVGRMSYDGWNHIAAVWNGSSFKVYLNGIQVHSGTAETTSTSTSLIIGNQTDLDSNRYFNGFISNLRIIKGTALYTSNFIPPTRKLTKLPGTVLLCCQDSNDPTTEATGKTIVGYGDLEQDPPELVTDGGFDSAANWPSAGADWTISGGVATISSADSGYDFLGTLTSSATNGLLYELTFDITNWTAGRLELAQSDSSNIGVTVTGNGSYTFRFRYTGTTNGNISLYAYTGSTSSFTLDNVSLKRVSQKRKGSDFTPSVGSDGSVVFDGTTKINTPNYFYLPTGPTEQRDSGAGVRGVIMGGYTTPENSIIDYINIATTGNAITFGTLTTGESSGRKASSTTRGLCAGSNGIQYITIPSAGDSQDFGTLNAPGGSSDSGCSSSTRGIFAGGISFGPTTWHNNIDYVTISTTGDAVDFGDLSEPKTNMAGLSSPTRGVFAGGYSPNVNTIDYITIASTGDAQDFGDLINVRFRNAGCSSSVRGVIGGGQNPGWTNSIEYITIASTGNAQDFGDLSQIREFLSATSSQIRGIFSGGSPGPTYDGVNTIDYVTIAITSTATDFGDLTVARGRSTVVSSGHGGLG